MVPPPKAAWVQANLHVGEEPVDELKEDSGRRLFAGRGCVSLFPPVSLP